MVSLNAEEQAEGPDSLPHLIIPKIIENPGGWGPVVGAHPEKFKDLPYQPFKKQDLLGKVSDWTGATYGDSRRARMYNSSMGQGSGVFGYVHDQNEKEFTLVDDMKVTKPRYTRSRYQPNQNRWGNNQQNRNQQQNNRFQQARGRHNNRGRRNYRPNYRHWWSNTTREPSVKIEDDWKLVDTLEFTNLLKMKNVHYSAGTDLMTSGSLKNYDRKYDQVSFRNKIKLLPDVLRKIDFQLVSTSEDPVIRKITKQHANAPINVITTESILSTLMCSTRSIIPWDIVVHKYDDKRNKIKHLVFDIDTDRKQYSPIDMISVSETVNIDHQTKQVDDDDKLNSTGRLTEEATYINQAISQQALKPQSKVFRGQNPYPFETSDGMEPPSRLYRYRQFFLDKDKTIKLLVRSEVDAYEVLPGKREPSFVNIKALNQWDPTYLNGINWKKSENQKSTILATEMKNNSFKCAKWIVGSIIAGVSSLKLGYVTRENFKDNSNHSIVNMESYTPSNLAQVAALSMDNCWGIMKTIIEKLSKEEDGQYYIIRNPNEKEISIYQKPKKDDSDDSGEESSDGDEESGSSSSGSGSSESGSSSSDDEEGDKEEKKE